MNAANLVQTPEQRLAILIGQLAVDNAKLGTEVDTLRIMVAAEKTRADLAESRLAAATDETGT